MERKVIKPKEFNEKINELDKRYGKNNYFIYEEIIDFDNEELLEEDVKGNASLPRLGKCVIVSYNNEGDNIPHFHVDSITTKFNTAVRLDICDYFLHNPNHVMFRNKKQTKTLQEVLFSKGKENNNKTLWEKLIENWNLTHEGKFKLRIKDEDIPDYSKLPTKSK